MHLEFKWSEFLKFSFIFSILFFLLCLQTLTFSDVSSTSNKSIEPTNENSLTNTVKKNFINISENNNYNNKTSFSQNQNKTLNEQKIKIVAAGDFGCRPVAQNNINQIELQKPDIFLVLGDLSYEPTMDCWYSMTKGLNSKIKIAIGNHEDYEEKAKGGSKELKDSLLKHYNLQNSYYSFDYGNVHFLVLDTQLEFSLDIFKILDEDEKEENNYNNKDEESNKPNAKYYATTLKDLLDSHNIKAEIPPFYLLNDEVVVEDIPLETEQYKFVVNDLKKANNNPYLDWIVVMFHKPFYSSLTSHSQEYIMREKYQPLFDKYGVDIVLQGHNHMYDRTLPLQFNPQNISKPIVDESNNPNKFLNPEGSIFSVIGLGGRSSHIFLNQPDYVVKQHNGFGFLSIEIKGKELDAKYYDIGYKCKEQKLKESDLEEGDFTIYEMSTCKKDKSKNDLEIIDHYIISK
ncbi:MAG TPA: metallophosphoesterase [Nitrososphaeraceae archaeon]